MKKRIVLHHGWFTCHIKNPIIIDSTSLLSKKQYGSLVVMLFPLNDVDDDNDKNKNSFSSSLLLSATTTMKSSTYNDIEKNNNTNKKTCTATVNEDDDDTNLKKKKNTVAIKSYTTPTKNNKLWPTRRPKRGIYLVVAQMAHYF